MAILRAALLYAAAAFACGFAFGVVRTLWLTPTVGALPAVLIEGPFMLAACWWICRFVLHRWPVGPKPASLWAMGAIWFCALQVLEIAFGVGAIGLSATTIQAAYLTPAGLLGLAWMLIAATFPVLQGWNRH